MTLASAALLALLPLAAPARPPLAVTRAAERIPLPVEAGAVRLDASPFEKKLTLHVAPAAAAAVARRIRDESRICPALEVGASTVSLRCRTARVRASLELGPRQVALDLREINVLPWRPGEEAAPFVPFDTEALRLGPCPGESAVARGECALNRGDVDAARAAFEEALRAGPAPLASLRLGDLALAADEPEVALEHWARARAEAPWGRLAAARICELEAECLASEEREAIFDATAVAAPLRADMVLRRVRLRAFDDQVVEAARALVPEHGAAGACAAAPDWCRHLLTLALGLPAPEGTAALAVYLETPGRLDGPDALALAHLAASQAEAAGAPVFAAQLLASLSQRVPPDALSAHLLRVARLFLEGGDRVRADEIVRYARTRLPAPELRRPEWAAVVRGSRPGHRARAVPPPSADADLAAAARALDAARLVHLTKGASR